MPLIDILDIDSSAPRSEITDRIRDRHRYFSTLLENAPTSQLRAIYQRKLADLQSLAEQYGVVTTSGPPMADAGSSPSLGTLPMLVLHTEGQAERPYRLTAGVNIIGRRQGAIVIDDDYMSKAHAVVEVSTGPVARVLLYDIGEHHGQQPSTNGVFLNGNEARLQRKVMLNVGDTFQVGYSKLVLVYATTDGDTDAVRRVAQTEYARTVFIKVN